MALIVSVGAVLDEGEASRFRDGDPDAVRKVYRAYGRLAFTVAYKVLGDRGLAEEATQQTFVRAWRAAGDYDLARELGPQLALIAWRAAIDILPLAGSGYDVWKVRRAVVGLSDDEQQIIRLQHFEGLTHVEIAERLGISVSTVESRSSRAHRRLVGELRHLREGPDERARPGAP